MKGEHFYSVSNEKGGGMGEEMLWKLGRSGEKLKYVSKGQCFCQHQGTM